MTPSISKRLLLVAMACLLLCAGVAQGKNKKPTLAQKRGKMENLFVYVGTYTNKSSKGIYLFELDMTSGALKPRGLVAEVSSPSFLAIHPNRRYMYSVNEGGSFQGKPTGSVSAFSIDPKTGHLKMLNQESSRGSGPCHLVVDNLGKNVLLANYSSGSVASLPIQADGTVGEATGFGQHKGSSVNAQRQEGPHAHSIQLSPDNRFAFSPDLGLDKVMIYQFDAKKGTLTPNDPPAGVVAPGAGPRHFAFHPTGRYAYVINELNSSITAFNYDSERGALTELQTISTLPPEGFQGDNWPSEILVHPSGKFLYGSNRGFHSIAIYEIDTDTGKLRFVGCQPTVGEWPRNFNIDPSGTFLLSANEHSDSIVVFRIDPQTGKLTQVGQPVAVANPACVKFFLPYIP